MSDERVRSLPLVKIHETYYQEERSSHKVKGNGDDQLQSRWIQESRRSRRVLQGVRCMSLISRECALFSLSIRQSMSAILAG